MSQKCDRHDLYPIPCFLQVKKNSCEGGRIISSAGKIGELKDQVSLLEQTDSISLELSAALSAGLLGFPKILPARFKQIYVSQPVVDEIHDAIAKCSLDKLPGGTLGKGCVTIGSCTLLGLPGMWITANHSW